MFSSLPSHSLPRSSPWSGVPAGPLAPFQLLPHSLASTSQWSSHPHVQRPGDEWGPGELDVFKQYGGMGVHQALLVPPQDPDDVQSEVVYVDSTRNRLSEAVLSCLHVRPNTVILHVYDLNEGLSQANDIAVFQVGMGGAFHLGTEVYGGEWAYGTSGVSCAAPRSVTGHSYKCSVILGCTQLEQTAIADVLRTMVAAWGGQDYDLMSKNCCGFASEFCSRLGVGPLPPWTDRLPRVVSQGQRAGQNVGHRATALSTEAQRLAQELPGKLQPHLQYAAQVSSQLGSQMMASSRAAISQADQQAQDMITRMWMGYGAADGNDDEAGGSSPSNGVASSSLAESPTATLSMGLNPTWAFAPLGELRPMSLAFDSQMTIPAYPSFDHGSAQAAMAAPSIFPNLALGGNSVMQGGSMASVNTAPSLVSQGRYLQTTMQTQPLQQDLATAHSGVFVAPAAATALSGAFAAPASAQRQNSAVSSQTPSRTTQNMVGPARANGTPMGNAYLPPQAAMAPVRRHAQPQAPVSGVASSVPRTGSFAPSMAGAAPASVSNLPQAGNLQSAYQSSVQSAIRSGGLSAMRPPPHIACASGQLPDASFTAVSRADSFASTVRAEDSGLAPVAAQRPPAHSVSIMDRP